MRKALLGGVLLVLLLSGRVVATSGPAQQPALAAVTTGEQRTYYIAAEEVLWDYAPHDRNDIAGRAWNPDEQVFVENGPTRIGHVYRKSLFRGYTDASFSKRVVVPTTCPAGVKPCDDTLGMMGPVIRAVVGDTVKVVFKNNTSYPASIHPHGVLYDKADDPAPARHDDGLRHGA